MNQFEFGILGSIVYGGLTLGAGLATGIFNSSKYIKSSIISTLFMNAVFLYLFTISNSFYICAALRFGIGFFQVFSVIFMPVWADAFASEK
jgi:hypothetical protein